MTKHRNSFLTSALVLFCMSGLTVAAQDSSKTPDLSQWLQKYSTADETPQQYNQRMKWFRNARFGLFIHWGLYSELGGEWNGRVSENGEWVQYFLNIPTSDYQKLKNDFNPVKYDPAKWADLFKKAGLKYVCITTKHHDGFCMWDSKVNDNWDIAATPYRKDVLKPLAAACRDQGLKFCIYYSVLDWHHPLWPGRPAFNDVAAGEPDLTSYENTYMYPQLEELFSELGPIGMIWFDGTWGGQWNSDNGKALEKYVRKLQPSVIINNRSGYNPPQPGFDFLEGMNAYGFQMRGDYITPEREVPPIQLPGLTWETCQTVWKQNTWGYHRLAPFRSTKELIHLLVGLSDRGGNLLLNVGPTAEGEIPPQARELLLNIGKWLSVNGDSIYGTEANPFNKLSTDGVLCTRKDNTLYFHMIKWPGVGELMIPVRNKVVRAYMLADRQTQLPVADKNGVPTVSLPAAAPDPYDSVLAVEFKGELVAVPSAQMPAETVRLKAREADLCGTPTGLKIEQFDGVESIGYWLKPADWVEWTFTTAGTAEYDVYMDLACNDNSAGSDLTLDFGGRRIDFSVPATGPNWSTFEKHQLGTVELAPGQHTAILKAHNMTGQAIINIRNLILEPTEKTGIKQN